MVIEFTDVTLIESEGNFKKTVDIMKQDGSNSWMLETKALVSAQIISCYYLLHCWSHGDVCIMSTDHPLLMEAPDDDIRELNEWCRINGWKSLSIHKNLILDYRHFEFWLRMYRSGLIESTELKRHEQDESDRFSKAIEETEDDDVD